MNSIKDIVTSIIENGYIAKPYVGISVADVSAENQSYGLPQGAAVKTVVEGSPAEEAGLQLNDIVTHVNGEAISGSSALVALVKECQVGDELVFTVFRQGQTLEITVTVGESIQSATEQQTENQQSSGNGYNGFPWGFGGFGY